MSIPRPLNEGPHSATHLLKIGYSVEAWPMLHENAKVYVVHFVARPAFESTDVETDRVTVRYPIKDGHSDMDDTDDSAKAEWHVRGSIKWDGCMDYRYNSERGIHLCGPGDAEKEAELLRCLFRIAAQLMPETCDFRTEIGQAEADA